jgi:hypothetical protein
LLRPSVVIFAPIEGIRFRRCFRHRGKWYEGITAIFQVD